MQHATSLNDIILLLKVQMAGVQKYTCKKGYSVLHHTAEVLVVVFVVIVLTACPLVSVNSLVPAGLTLLL